MNEKINFAVTINDLDNHLPKSRGDCFDYGSWYGCDNGCPQLLRGECEGDLPVIFKSLEIDEIDELYKQGFYKEEIEDYISENNIEM